MLPESSGLPRPLGTPGSFGLKVAARLKLALATGAACLVMMPTNARAQPGDATSPGGILTASFELRDGVPYYSVSRLGQPFIRKSRLGFKLRGDTSLEGEFVIDKTTTDKIDKSWVQVWGEEKQIRNNYTELRVHLKDRAGNGRLLNIVFRIYDDGIGFRYEIPEQPQLPAMPGSENVLIMDELTEFRLTGDHRTWWIPAYEHNRYEYHYTDSPLSKTGKVHTPVTMETKDGLYLSFHEAALTDFASMTLWRKKDNTLEADLVPWSDGVKVRGTTPMRSPWRTIQVSDSPGGLIDSYLVLNLNEPNMLEDVSWIKPGKYVGIWWEMHLGVSTWGSGPKHGATTQNTRRYLDFAAQHGFDGVLVEGWNVGWDGDWMANSNKYSFTQPYPDFDLASLAEHARNLGVRLIGHHETAAGIENYERQMEDAFAQCRKHGIRAVKTGYVAHGRSIRRKDESGKTLREWHHGQFMVRHYRKVIETAAKYQVMIDVHEPIKDTGIRRTYPNMMTREGACGQEFNAWGGINHNPPDHTTILPFTRLLAGPMDFTPGIFDLLFKEAKPNDRVRTTLAKQLALYVVIFSPLNMAADLPKNYEANPKPFEFIKEVPVDWSETEVLHARIGDYVTVARKSRNNDDWYIGSITDENPRVLSTNLHFLDPGRNYTATIYRDGPDAHWNRNPYPVRIEEQTVYAGMKLDLRLAPGGGTAIRIRPLEN